MIKLDVVKKKQYCFIVNYWISNINLTLTSSIPEKMTSTFLGN